MKPLIAGIGNPDRGDDAAGPLVARLLTGRVDADIVTCAGDLLGLIDTWAGRKLVILVDAAAMQTEPGAIHRIQPLRDLIPPGVSFASSHGFGVAEVIALAQTLNQLPERLIVYAIEGADFRAGARMSDAVTRAADTVSAVIAATLSR